MQVALDIGGTLTKLVCYIPSSEYTLSEAFHAKPEYSLEWLFDKVGSWAGLGAAAAFNDARRDLDFELPVRGGTLHFMHFPNIDTAVTALRRLLELQTAYPHRQKLYVTGGGAYKDRVLLESMGVPLQIAEEMPALVDGVRYMLDNSLTFTVGNAAFGGDIEEDRDKLVKNILETPHEDGFLLVNIGSGVSMVEVTRNSYNRVGGSSLGGSTFLGLTCLLTGCQTFDEAIELAMKGNSRAVDLLVGDIYGTDGMDKLGLRPTALAASFGKMVREDNRENILPEDLALSALVMLSMNVAAMARLHARQLKRQLIVYAGNFLRGPSSAEAGRRGNHVAIRTLAYATEFVSNKELTAAFFTHEGYTGSLGMLADSLGVQPRSLGGQNGQPQAKL